MKYIKSYILFVLMVFAVTGCTMDDLKDDVNDLKDRVTLIEQQVKLLNDNLATVGYILDPQNKTISKVETKVEGDSRQYVITLSDGEELTLTIGKEGTVDEPEITIGEDGKWYINGVSTGVTAVGENGKNGEGFPEFRVQDGNWQVRFGDGDWGNVQGGAGIAGSSLGDQLFESAEVDGNNFVVTLKDGSVHTLPIVETLVCIIDRTELEFDDEDFLIINKGERKEIPVKIEGEKMQVTYPEGWRATLNKLDDADENGNNYKLFIFAPAADTRTLTRAAADNMADVTIQVQKGSFWAVDKIKVKNPKELNSNEDKYNDGQTIRVGGLDITSAVYGAPKDVPDNGNITEPGVYFIKENNMNLTVANALTDLLILPNTDDVATINLNISAQLTVTKNIVLKNVILISTVNNNVLRFDGANANAVFENCKIYGLKNTKALMVPQSAGTHSLKYCAIVHSEIRFDESEANVINNAGFPLINNMDCEQIVFENNIVYGAHTVTSADRTTNHIVNFKIISANARALGELSLNSNTFVDVETSASGGVTGLIYTKTIGKITMNNNLFHWTNPTNKFLDGNGVEKTSPTTLIFRFDRTAVLDANNAESSNNYYYNGNPDMGVKLWYSSGGTPVCPNTLTDLVQGELFDTTNSDTFNKSTGVFIPKDEYKAYGAQR